MTALFEFKEKEQAKEEVKRRIAALMTPQKKETTSIKDILMRRK